MKTNAIIRIVLFSVAIIILAGILCAGLGVNQFLIHTETPIEATVAQMEGATGDVTTPTSQAATWSENYCQFDPAQIRELQIEWAAGSITIQPTDTDTIEVREYGNGEPFICRQSGDKLTVKFDDVEVYFGITVSGSKDLVITVPRDWVCRELEIEVASAEIEVADMTIQSVDIDAASGDCRFDGCSVGDLDIDTASGDLHFTGTLDTLDCDAASADCILVLSNVPAQLDLDCASGDLDITLPENSGFTVQMDGLSTHLNTEFDCTMRNDRYVCGDGSCRIDVDAMSGDLTIRKGPAHHVHDEACDGLGSSCPDNHHN